MYKYVTKITKEEEAAWEGVKGGMGGESNIIPFYLTTYLKKKREREINKEMGKDLIKHKLKL